MDREPRAHVGTVGSPHPPGATWDAGTRRWNFTLFSRHAHGVTLLLFSPRDTARPRAEITLDPIRNRTGVWWHIALDADQAGDSAYYAYRVHGPPAGPGGEHRFDPEKVLLDPYAPAILFPKGFARRAAIESGDNIGRAPLGVLPRIGTPSDEQSQSEPGFIGSRPRGGEIIYEMHVKGFTAHPSSGVAAARRGSFAGIVDRLPHLVELGVTAVELMPIFQFDPQEGNYWGYMPLSFFAVHDGYASRERVERAGERDRPFASWDEFREMVRAFHAAGIAVYLDVVHNHTGEGDLTYPTYSLRGIDNASYYTVGRDAGAPPEKPYRDYTGCGHSMNVGNHETRQLVVESLRWFTERAGVDGFRHDLLTANMRGSDGGLPSDPVMAAAMRSWSGFEGTRQIAEPWDAAGGYQLGRSFPIPSAWQWNDRFRDAIRRFVRGDGGMVGEVMQRLYGSDDFFPDRGEFVYRPVQSVNYITSHDGFSLYDLVAYAHRRNHANGHDNRDGASEASFNCGHEGDDGVPDGVLSLRVRQARNLVALLLLAAGTPMLRMGDEVLHTQAGNNNPYNQDNETTWINWTGANRAALGPRGAEVVKGFHRFVRRMIALRRSSRSLSRDTFWRGDVRWHGSTGGVDWSHHSRELAFSLAGVDERDPPIYAIASMGDDDKAFAIQSDHARSWRRVIDTARESPHDAPEPGRAEVVRGSTHVEGRSVVVLVGE